MVAPGCSNTTAFNGVFDEANSNPSYFSSENMEAMKPLPMCGAGYKRRKKSRRRKTRKASRKKRRQTKRAGSGVFDTVYDSIFGKQEKPPPKPKKSSRSSDEFEVLDEDPLKTPEFPMGRGDKGYSIPQYDVKEGGPPPRPVPQSEHRAGPKPDVPKPKVPQTMKYRVSDLRLLGLGPDPTRSEIRKAYRSKTVKGKHRHPDKGGNPELFKELNNANERVEEVFNARHPTASKKKRPKKTMKKRKKHTSKKR